MAKTATYNNQSYTFPDTATPTQIKVALAAIFPELTNGSYREVSGVIEFFVAAQNKSAKTATYNNQSYTFPDSATPAQIKVALAAIFPELTNGSYRENGTVIEFFVAAQNKSAKTATYNNQSYTFPDSATPAQIKVALAAIFPELTNGSYRENGTVIEFFVAAQNKSLTVREGGHAQCPECFFICKNCKYSRA